MENQMSKQELEQYWEGLKMLIDLAEGDNSIVESTIDDVLEHTPATLQEMKDGLTQNDSKKIQLAAHSMKSSMMLVGADYLSSLCQQLELLTKQGQLTEAPKLSNQILQEYDRLQYALQEWKLHTGQ